MGSVRYVLIKIYRVIDYHFLIKKNELRRDSIDHNEGSAFEHHHLN